MQSHGHCQGDVQARLHHSLVNMCDVNVLCWLSPAAPLAGGCRGVCRGEVEALHSVTGGRAIEERGNIQTFNGGSIRDVWHCFKEGEIAHHNDVRVVAHLLMFVHLRSSKNPKRTSVCEVCVCAHLCLGVHKQIPQDPVR